MGIHRQGHQRTQGQKDTPSGSFWVYRCDIFTLGAWLGQCCASNDDENDIVVEVRRSTYCASTFFRQGAIMLS